MQLGGRAGERHAAVAEGVDAVGDLENLANFLLDEQDDHAVVTIGVVNGREVSMYRRWGLPREVQLATE